MKLVIEAEASMRLEMMPDGFEVMAEGGTLSPYHLLAGSLASCTALTLQSWAESVGVAMAPLVIRVTWTLSEEKPARVERINMELRWPGLPQERVGSVERLADLCPIHATLARAAEVSRRVLPLPIAGSQLRAAAPTARPSPAADR